LNSVRVGTFIVFKAVPTASFSRSLPRTALCTAFTKCSFDISSVESWLQTSSPRAFSRSNRPWLSLTIGSFLGSLTWTAYKQIERPAKPSWRRSTPVSAPIDDAPELRERIRIVRLEPVPEAAADEAVVGRPGRAEEHVMLLVEEVGRVARVVGHRL